MMNKLACEKALLYAEDFDIGKITFEICIVGIFNLARETLAEKDYEACEFIHKVGGIVTKEFTRKQTAFNKHYHIKKH